MVDLNQFKKMDRLTAILMVTSVVIVVGLIVGGVYLINRSKKTVVVSSNTVQRRTFGGQFSRFGTTGQRPTIGSVSTVNGTSFTLVDRNGATINVQTSSSTQYGQTGATSSTSTVAVGDLVVVNGQANSSGIVQATRILINPTFGARGFGGGNSQSQTSMPQGLVN